MSTSEQTPVSDCGSYVSYTTELECDVEDCTEKPKWWVGGHLHFKFDGVEYSCDRFQFCDHHLETIRPELVDDGVEE